MRSRGYLALVVPVMLVSACGGTVAMAQNGADGEVDTAPIAQRTVAVVMDSGPVASALGLGEREVVWSAVVSEPGAAWMRLKFGACELGGDAAADGAVIRITSMADGAQQHLNAEQLGFWQNASAYFNGDTVVVDLLAFGGVDASRVVIESAVVDGSAGFGVRSICGATDDRALSTVKGNGRLMPMGCTGWLFNDANRMGLTAGHCGVSATSTLQFNVPLSTSGGGLVNPTPANQFALDGTSAQQLNGGVGNDYSYWGTLPNSETGLTAAQSEGAFYTLANAPATSTQQIRIVGFGTTSAPVSSTWTQVQKTHSGAYTGLTGTTVRYATDTTGGNSGSPVVLATTGTAIGIHTHAGCNATGGANQGTAIQIAGLQTMLNAPLGICDTGRRTVGVGAVYASGDLANNFGRFALAAQAGGIVAGNFGKVAQIGASIQGLAFDPIRNRHVAVDTSKQLWAITPGTGASVLLGAISGGGTGFQGLAFDPRTDTLFAMDQVTGQLYVIDQTTRSVTARGTPRGGSVGAIDFDPNGNILYGIGDVTAGSRLVRIDPATGIQTVLGSLGAGIVDCNGLAFNPGDGQLYTVNATTEQLLRVNPANGVATVVGASRGMFGAGFGMDAEYVWVPPCDDLDFNNDGNIDPTDVDAYFSVLGEGQCLGLPVGQVCGDLDFNNDGNISPMDVDAYFSALGEGPCIR